MCSKYLTMQMRHIFYPTLELRLDDTYQKIEKYYLKGLYHDEDESLEKSGKFKFLTKFYGKASHGAEECFIGVTDWGNGIICEEQTFFPASWSKEKVVREVMKALTETRTKTLERYYAGNNLMRALLECQGPNNLILNVLIDSDNVVIAAYPSIKNF